MFQPVPMAMVLESLNNECHAAGPHNGIHWDADHPGHDAFTVRNSAQ